jgi:hypothetical protein
MPILISLGESSLYFINTFKANESFGEEERAVDCNHNGESFNCNAVLQLNSYTIPLNTKAIRRP